MLKSSIILGAVSLICTASLAAADDYFIADPVNGCQIASTEPVEEGEHASWTGPCKDGFASGHGVLVWVLGGTIYGTYEGGMSGGQLHGGGNLFVKDDDGYSRLTGRFENGKANGLGVFVASNGDRFEGEFLNGERHGLGRLETSGGAFYDGDFENGLPNGRGQSMTADGEEYIGTFHEGKRHGDGFLIEAGGEFYAGQFENGFASGNGHFEAPDGSDYTGTFVMGVPDGVGTYKAPDGTKYQGLFAKGKLDGSVLITPVSGEQQVQTWKNGEQVK